MNKKIFVSFHHDLNQDHATKIRKKITEIGYEDISVNDGIKIENEDQKNDFKQIREEIRDKFLKDADVIIVVVGSDSINRKHIDWEIRSGLYKFKDNKNAGVVVINCLTNEDTWILDKKLIELHDAPKPYPAGRKWPESFEKKDYEWLPQRLFNSIKNQYSYEKNLKHQYDHAVFPIILYKKSLNKAILKRAIDHAYEYRKRNTGKWDLNSKMRRKNNVAVDRKKFEQYEA